MTTDDAIKPIEHYQEYLLVLARLHRMILFQARLDPSDIVQMTLLKAHKKFDQFGGQNGREQAAWLRKILTNTMIDAVRKARPEGGPGRVSLEEALEQSSARLEAVLGSDSSDPGSAVEREELLTRLARVLAQLPEDQCQAIGLRYLQGLSLGEIGQQMERSTASVAGLLQRGLRQLREVLQEG